MRSRFGAAVLLLLSLPVAAATFTVTSGADTGPGTLRQAILDANANPGQDQIVLQVDVALDTSLPGITDQVDITGAISPSGRHRIDVNTPAVGRLVFQPTSAGSTVRSIGFGPGATAIRISTSFVTVTDVTVTGSLVQVTGDNNTIGGAAPSDRNTISSILVTGDFNVILGNTITNTQLLGAHQTQIGTAAAGNQLGGVVIEQSLVPQLLNNNTGPIRISQILTPGAGPTVTGNTINGGIGPGLHLDNVTGGLVSGNAITGSTGVEIVDAIGIEITRNSILATVLAIDLDADGFTANDAAPDPDLGANSRQNFPVLTAALLTPDSLVVHGTLTSAPLTPYRIELFANDAPNPDARTFLGSFNVTTDATGNATFAETITSPLPAANEVITATATNIGFVVLPGNTPQSTSEVSLPLGISQPGSLGFETSAQSVDEEAGTVTITVRRTGGSEGAVTVDYATSDGTASAPADYTSTSGTLAFDGGVTERTIVVPIVNDSIAEGNERFTVTLSNALGGATIGRATTTITINDAADAAGIPTASTWALIVLALGLALVALRR